MATYGFRQLEQLWIRAGGPRNLAPTMAAVALAESGGRTDAHNPSGASGLWQILGNPFPGNAFDPLTNARMAVAKWKSQGLGAWVTYTNGDYRKFLSGQSGHGAPPPAGPGGNFPGSGLLGVPGQVVGAFASAGTAVDWLLQPSHWIRIFAFTAGVGNLLLGVWLLSHAGGST
jgi:hypothetical protein